MKSDMVSMNKKIEKLERILARQEQYSCCNCLLLHGSEHEHNNDLVLKTLNEKMHVDLTFSDLERTYRIGRMKASCNKLRAAIIKFVSYYTRKKLFQIKNGSKEPGIWKGEGWESRKFVLAFYCIFFWERLSLMFHPSYQNGGKILSIEKPPVGRRGLRN